MKQIKLTHFRNNDKNSIYKRDHYYSVSLGNDVKRTFTDRKSIDKYFVQVNSELNNCLVEIISLLTETYKCYWLNWFYDNEVKHDFTQIEKYIQLAVDRSCWTNGNYFTFNYLNFSLDILDKTINEIIEVRTSKNHYAEVKQLKALQYRIFNLRIEISLIGSK